MLTAYLVAVADPASRLLHVQLYTYDWREAVEVVLAMRREMPGVRCGAVGRVVSVEELAAVGGREVWE